MARTAEFVARRVLRTRDAALYLGIAASTLEKLRSNKSGPRFVRMGRAVGYDLGDLDEWLDRQRDKTSR